MTTPVRIQRKRTRGFDLQAASRAINGLECVYVGRPTMWGNPFSPGGWFQIGRKTAWGVMAWSQAIPEAAGPTGGFTFVESNEQAVAMFREYVSRFPRKVAPLCGKNLACWCALGGAPCHADVLLEIANRPICEAVE